MAEAAWEQLECASAPGSYSPDYGFGFREGFADYLDAGPGDLPALPPRRYWQGRYQTPAGHQAILDWYAGFAHGARVAAASGYRQFVTLPSPFLSSAMELRPLPAVAEPEAEAIPTPLPEADANETSDIEQVAEPRRFVVPAHLHRPLNEPGEQATEEKKLLTPAG
jgi:hypothetical protein